MSKEKEFASNFIDYVLSTVNDVFQAEHGTKEVMFDSEKMVNLTKQAKAKLEKEMYANEKE